VCDKLESSIWTASYGFLISVCDTAIILPFGAFFVTTPASACSTLTSIAGGLRKSFIVAIGCFIGGVKYADKTSGIPKDGRFEIDGYFTNIQKNALTIFDGEYPYFTNRTGASEEEANAPYPKNWTRIES